MTIDYKIIIGHPLDEQNKSDIQKVIASVFEEIDAIYNKWNPFSELSALNDLSAGIEFPISSKLEYFLRETQSMVELSQGRFDPTVEPLQQLWKQKLTEGRVPSETEIAEIAPAIGWHHIHLGPGTFCKNHDKTRLDLGGIAKGYAVDLLVEKLLEMKFLNIFVEWGGEIRALGQHPDHRPWTIFISRLGDSNEENAIAYLSLHDEAVATSGDYFQNWRVEKTTYFHIFDPCTLKPLIVTPSSIASATVRAPTCALADALATTALMFPSIDEALSWTKKIQEKIPHTTFWLISREQIEINKN